MVEFTLSEAGAVRREAMRTMLVGTVVRRRRRRRALRVAVAVVLLAGGGLWLVAPEATGPKEQPVAVSGGPAPLIEMMRDDPSVQARLSCGGPVTSIQFLDDTSLVVELQQNGRAAGVVRRGSRVDVLPRIDDDWQQMQ